MVSLIVARDVARRGRGARQLESPIPSRLLARQRIDEVRRQARKFSRASSTAATASLDRVAAPRRRALAVERLDAERGTLTPRRGVRKAAPPAEVGLASMVISAVEAIGPRRGDPAISAASVAAPSRGRSAAEKTDETMRPSARPRKLVDPASRAAAKPLLIRPLSESWLLKSNRAFRLANGQWMVEREGGGLDEFPLCPCRERVGVEEGLHQLANRASARTPPVPSPMRWAPSSPQGEEDARTRHHRRP